MGGRRVLVNHGSRRKCCFGFNVCHINGDAVPIYCGLTNCGRRFQGMAAEVARFWVPCFSARREAVSFLFFHEGAGGRRVVTRFGGLRGTHRLGKSKLRG